jgi:hypothetical protein
VPPRKVGRKIFDWSQLGIKREPGDKSHPGFFLGLPFSGGASLAGSRAQSVGIRRLCAFAQPSTLYHNGLSSPSTLAFTKFLIGITI